MKKNSNSCADESATEPTTKPASEDSNMSAGAEMLIERMKTNPEDFKYGGRFYRVVDAINAKGQGWISERDYRALASAYQEHMQEPDFTEWVYGEIFNPKEPDVAAQNVYAQMQGQKSQIQSQMAQQMGSAIYGNAIQNNLSSAPGSWTVSTGSAATNAIKLGNTTLSESMLTQIKNKLGL